MYLFAQTVFLHQLIQFPLELTLAVLQAATDLNPIQVSTDSPILRSVLGCHVPSTSAL